ncbi:YgiT-type zinc finger protein [Bacillus sp. V33-4]|uniref:YgiT-type zinc finger protein n=1 Tax=Bacillus sp. V33-4 TaxID=2054169 RepID=UPI000C7663E3|nr:YgiT-type zinc finger protein [Bacillus sp. V33-4]PLR84359.1 hypothetical protein CVD23_12055 [Bacillus sp. V33-4]
MKCPLCHSALVDNQLVTVKRFINGEPVYFQNVPAQICSNPLCGEEILHGTIVKEMKSIINNAKEASFQFERTFDFKTGQKYK